MSSNNVTHAQFFGFTKTPVVSENQNLNLFELHFCHFSKCSSTLNAGCTSIRCKSFLSSSICFEFSHCYNVELKNAATIYTYDTNVNICLVSAIYCSDKNNPNFDTSYFRLGKIFASNFNVSECYNSQSTGIQGTENNNFSISYLLATNGQGWCSVEMYLQSKVTYIDHSVLSNNTCLLGDKCVVYLLDSDTIQVKNVILSKNIGKGFSGGKQILINCYYYSDYEPGISTDTPGLIMLNQPTMSWLTFHFDTKNCHPRLVGENTDRKKGAIQLIGLFLIALSKSI